MKLVKILNIATYAGRVMLENGGETYRVEEVIYRICHAYNIEIDCYATITGIMATVRNLEGEHESTTIRIIHRTMNLDIIHRVNDLCRNVHLYTLDEFYKKLLEIKNEPKFSLKINLIAYSLAGASFTLLFGGDYKDFLASMLIGVIIFYINNYFENFDVNSFFVNCIGSSVLAFMAVIFYKLNLIDNYDLVISGTIMLLVPGMALTNSVRDLIAGDYMAGIARGVEAFLIATSLAAGSGVILALFL